ncbi:hypothetical protein [Streptomyces sp. AGS-58]|uniref:hypothetical protein n=1 Tax=unclassified Streptomyces TaxID=2593676 RepID=UPI0035A3BBDE
MTAALNVLIWIAEHLGWWWLLFLTPGMAAWAWAALRPTGRHRRPWSGPSAEATAPNVDRDTLALPRLTCPSGEATD